MQYKFRPTRDSNRLHKAAYVNPRGDGQTEERTDRDATRPNRDHGPLAFVCGADNVLQSSSQHLGMEKYSRFRDSGTGIQVIIEGRRALSIVYF